MVFYKAVFRNGFYVLYQQAHKSLNRNQGYSCAQYTFQLLNLSEYLVGVGFIKEEIVLCINRFVTAEIKRTNRYSLQLVKFFNLIRDLLCWLYWQFFCYQRQHLVSAKRFRGIKRRQIRH